MWMMSPLSSNFSAASRACIFTGRSSASTVGWRREGRMKTYDYIVVGSGISGLTVARILSQQGKSVLLLEKASILGGSVARFRIDGIPYDAGFHFTGGFTDERNGVLDTMLTLLGVRERIRPIYF